MFFEDMCSCAYHTLYTTAQEYLFTDPRLNYITN